PRARRVLVSTWDGRTSEAAGWSRTSSKVSPSGMGPSNMAGLYLIEPGGALGPRFPGALHERRFCGPACPLRRVVRWGRGATAHDPRSFPGQALGAAQVDLLTEALCREESAAWPSSEGT